MARVRVDIGPAEIAGYVRRLPRQIRWQPQRRWVWRTAPAFAPPPLLLLAFGFQTTAILTVVLFYLLALVAVRRISRQLRVYPVATTITVDDTGVTLDMGKVARAWPWYTITDIHEDEQLLCLVYMHGRHWLLIPRSSFAGPNECASFLAEARELRARHGQIPARDLEARAPHGQIEWGMTALFWVVAAGVGVAAWTVDSLVLRVVLGVVGIVLFGIGWPDPDASKKRLAPAAAPAPNSVQLPAKSEHGGLLIAAWMLAILLLDAAAEAGSTMRIVLGVLGVGASLVASGFSIDLFERLMHRGPASRVHELRVEERYLVLDSLEDRLLAPWSQLEPAKVGAQGIELVSIGGQEFAKVPRSAFVSEAHWTSFIEAVARAQARAGAK